MEEQTLKQFKAEQRKEMLQHISNNRLVNPITGFVKSDSHDNQIMTRRDKDYKIRMSK